MRSELTAHSDTVDDSVGRLAMKGHIAQRVG
jgi:hypothetical protein